LPEGVELRISKDLLQPLVVNKVVMQANTCLKGRYAYDKSGLGKLNQLISELPLTVSEVNVKGKFMYWVFSKDDITLFYMFSTFGMTGQWSYIEGKHPCFEFQFSDGSKIFFNDPRHFGTIKFTNNKQDLQNKLNDLGWDPFTPFKDNKNFIINALKYSNKTISEDLMNQKLFCGVGNYIRAEALYDCKISPWCLSKHLTEDNIIKLCESIIKVMEESYKHQGATISTYKDAYGAEGKYTSCFKVYGKKIDTNGYNIIKEKSGDGRTIHWCPDIQKIGS